MLSICGSNAELDDIFFVLLVQVTPAGPAKLRDEGRTYWYA